MRVPAWILVLGEAVAGGRTCRLPDVTVAALEPTGFVRACGFVVRWAMRMVGVRKEPKSLGTGVCCMMGGMRQWVLRSGAAGSGSISLADTASSLSAVPFQCLQGGAWLFLLSGRVALGTGGGLVQGYLPRNHVAASRCIRCRGGGDQRCGLHTPAALAAYRYWVRRLVRAGGRAEPTCV